MTKQDHDIGVCRWEFYDQGILIFMSGIYCMLYDVLMPSARAICNIVAISIDLHLLLCILCWGENNRSMSNTNPSLGIGKFGELGLIRPVLTWYLTIVHNFLFVDSFIINSLNFTELLLQITNICAPLSFLQVSLGPVSNSHPNWPTQVWGAWPYFFAADLCG